MQIRYPSFTVEDPRKTPDGRFAATAVRFTDASIRFTLKPDALIAFFDFTAKSEDGQPDGGAATSGADLRRPVTANGTIESGLIERLVTPMTVPVFDPKDNIVDNAAKFLSLAGSTRMDWYELKNLSYGSEMSDGEKTQTSYELIYGSGIHDGRIERAGGNGLKQTATLPENETITTSIDQLRVVGYDAGALVDVLLGRNATTKDGRTVMALAEYSGLKIQGPDGSFTATIGSVDAKGWRVRSADKPLAEVVKTFLADPSAVETDPFPFLSDFLPAVGGLYGLDSASMRDLIVGGPEEFSFSLGSVEIAKIDGDGIAAFSVRDAALNTSAAGSGSLDLFAINDVRFGSFKAMLDFAKGMKSLDEAATAAEGNPDAPKPDVNAVVEAALDAYPTVGFVELAGLNVDTPPARSGSTASPSPAATGTRRSPSATTSPSLAPRCP